jgi:tRNA U34 5-methylaminomethyl-2-thiouridine-forming methyltransferase MnmC
MVLKREIVTSEDGSTTINIPELSEHYHSVHGAITESNHVFIQEALSKSDKKKLTVFEVGFGTGLNALLTYLFSKRNKIETNYLTIEKYPLSIEEVSKLNYASELGIDSIDFLKFHNSDWEKNIELSDYFSLQKFQADLKIFHIPDEIDVVYFDAFGPDVQPELWTEDIFKSIYSSMNINGIITTYSAKGSVRRAMQSVGFKVERIPGPPGKREMLRGIKE